jgi:RimJ/RimL family protein N-acetyltransferase
VLRPEREYAPAAPELGHGALTSFRRFQQADAVDLLRWGKHEDVLLDSYNLGLRTVEDTRRWLDSRMSYCDAQLYSVRSTAEDRVVGYISIREIDLANRSSVLGISFDPGVMGRGYGTDALNAFLRCYFETWNYKSMRLDVAAPNLRARRCYEKCGFRYVGERWRPYPGSSRRALRSEAAQQRPDAFRYNKGLLSMLYCDMELLRESWEALHPEAVG